MKLGTGVLYKKLSIKLEFLSLAKIGTGRVMLYVRALTLKTLN